MWFLYGWGLVMFWVECFLVFVLLWMLLWWYWDYEDLIGVVVFGVLVVVFVFVVVWLYILVIVLGVWLFIVFVVVFVVVGIGMFVWWLLC